MTTLLQPGETWADHEILHHLATGDRAEVYAAIGPTGEPRALKIIATEENLTAKVHARLAQEGVALTMIVHPGVVRFHAVGLHQGRVWISLALIEGDTLRARLDAAGGRLPLDVVLYWIQQACDGLAEAHRVGVTHRDVTPENILVSPDDTVKVVDFGLANLAGGGVKTTTEQAVGSARYMAPEQVKSAPAHAGMDVYAICVVLYEAAAGVHPMGKQARTLIDVVSWQVYTPPPSLRALAPWVPSDLAALIHQGLEKDPAKRPTMRALTDGVRDALARLQAPLRREARNALPNRDVGLAPTSPMAVQDGPPEAIEIVIATGRPAVAAVAGARGGTIPMAQQASPPITPRAPLQESSAPTTDRSATVPSAPMPPASPPTAPMPPATVRAGAAMPPVPMPAAERASTPAGVRATDVPVESTIRRSTATPRRAPILGLAVGALTVATAAGWMLVGRTSEPASGTTPALPPVLSAVPSASASAPPVPTAMTSASAARGAPAPSKPTGAGVPARQPPRRTPAARPPAGPPSPAKNRIFGTEG
jgi:serine/threonine-protein kinase